MMTPSPIPQTPVITVWQPQLRIGSIVTITPVGAGTATITVTASDGSLTVTATQTISVTVNAANRAPTAVGSIPVQTLTAGDSALLLTVSGFFNDPDGDTLTYTANSSNDSVATANFWFSCRNQRRSGWNTITVTASDGRLTATQTISVTVNAANRAPTAVGSIPAQTLTAGGSALLLTVSGYFNDPDGDTLTYTATPVITVWQPQLPSGSQITITPSDQEL